MGNPEITARILFEPIHSGALTPIQKKTSPQGNQQRRFYSGSNKLWLSVVIQLLTPFDRQNA